MPETLHPGDQVTCQRCGTTAIAYSTQPATWRDGAALLVSWRGYVHQVAILASEVDVCLHCRHGIAPRARDATRRVAILDDLALHGCLADGFEWNTDAAIEDAYQRWISAGRPRCAVVSVHPGTSSFVVEKAEVPPTPPPAPSRPQLSLF